MRTIALTLLLAVAGCRSMPVDAFGYRLSGPEADPLSREEKLGVIVLLGVVIGSAVVALSD